MQATDWEKISTSHISDCGMRPKTTSQYYLLPWQLVKLRGLRMASLQVPHPTLLSQTRSSSQPTFSQGTTTRPTHPWVAGFSSLPAHGIIQTSQSQPPGGSKGHLTLLILYSHLSLPLVVHFVPKCNPRVALCGMQCPPSQDCEYVWLINYCWAHLSSFWLIMYSANPITLGQEFFPHQWGKREAINTLTKDLYPVYIKNFTV